MDLTVASDRDGTSPDELRSLRAWLVEDDELRGRVVTRESAAGADRLGPVLEGLQVAAGPAGMVLSASIVAWLRTRVGSVRLVVKSDRGRSVEVTAKNVHELDAAAVAELTDRIASLADEDGSAGEAAAGPDSR